MMNLFRAAGIMAVAVSTSAQSTLEEDVNKMVPLLNYKFRSTLIAEKKDPWVPTPQEVPPFTLNYDLGGFPIVLTGTLQEANGLSSTTITEIKIDDHNNQTGVASITLKAVLAESHLKASVEITGFEGKNYLAVSPRDLQLSIKADATLSNSDDKGVCVTSLTLTSVSAVVGPLNPKVEIDAEIEVLIKSFKPDLDIENMLQEQEATIKESLLPKIDDIVKNVAGSFFTNYLTANPVCTKNIAEEEKKAKEAEEARKAEEEKKAKEAEEARKAAEEEKKSGKTDTNVTGDAASTGMSISVFAAMFAAHMVLA